MMGLTLAILGAPSEASLKTFIPDFSKMTEFRPDVLLKFLELNIQEFNCFDQQRNVVADEFMRTVYSMAAKRIPGSPLIPDAIIDAALSLWSTTFAVLASTELFKTLSPTINATGIHSATVSRLIVVSPIAYIILGVLGIVVLLNISLFFEANEKSILLEEPVGLVSAAGILHNSTVSEKVGELVQERGFDGKVTAAVKRRDELMTERYRFHKEEGRRGRIVHYEGPGIPMKTWWRSLIGWAREMIVSNALVEWTRRLRDRIMGRQRL
jgi:hypothetical protein